MASIQQQVYASNLRQKFGYPLRNPRPNDKDGQQLSEPYGKEGFQIGDIGYVDNYGRFILAFNIQFPPDELRIQCRSLCPVEPLRFDLPVTVEGFKRDKVFGTGVKRDTQDTRPGHYVFNTTASKGAILILPNGAIFAELQRNDDLEAFRQHAMKCAFQWCRFVKQKSLYLITGVYKTNSWTLGSFYDGSPGEKIVISEQSGTHNTGTAPWFDWKCPFDVDFDYGPGNNHLYNQTILIKGFKITVKWDCPPVIEMVESLPERLLARILMRLRRWLSRKTIQYVPTVNLSQPLHPLDIANHILLGQNPDAQGAITHDNNWIEMLERGLLLADLMREDQMRAFIDQDVLGTQDNVVYLRNNIEGRRGELVQKPARDRDTTHASWSDSPRLATINMRLESIEIDSIYAGVCVLVQFGRVTRRTVNKPHASVIEWNDEIFLPMDQSVNIIICGASQLGSVLGTREISPKQTIDTRNLSGDIHVIRLCLGKPESRSSLLITLGRQFSSKKSLEIRTLEENSDFMKNTNIGFNALYSYHNDAKDEYLERALEFFQHALEHCGPVPACRATALLNLATSKFIRCQAYGMYSELYAPIKLYEEALELCACSHPDRPATLLLLSQALLSYYGWEHDEPTPVRIKHLLEEIHHDSTRYHQTAEVISRTCRLYQALNSRNLFQIDEHLKNFDRGMYRPPYGFFDRPQTLHKLGAAFWVRCLCDDRFDDLGKSITLLEEASRLIPDGHEDKASITGYLESASLLRRIEADGGLTGPSMTCLDKDTSSLVLDGQHDRTNVAISPGNSSFLGLIECLMNFDVDKASSAAAMLDVPKFHMYRMVCDILTGRDRIAEAITFFHLVTNDLAEETSLGDAHARWQFDYERRCRKRLDILGEVAMKSENYNEAVEHLSTALLLDPVNRADTLLKRSRANAFLGLWEEALGDAEEVIALDLLSREGYEMKHAILHGANRDAEAVDVICEMALILEESSDVDVPDGECQCRERIEEFGDEALDSENYAAALTYFSIILWLNPPDRENILMRQSRAQTLMMRPLDDIPHNQRPEDRVPEKRLTPLPADDPLGTLKALDARQNFSPVHHPSDLSEVHHTQTEPTWIDADKKEKDRGTDRLDRVRDKDRHEDDLSAVELTRMIGYLTATATEDSSIVLEVCGRASANETNAKEADEALRREFRYGEPKVQLAAAKLWAIMLQNTSEVFIQQISQPKFIGVLEEVLTSPGTSPVVRERLMEVLAAAAYMTSRSQSTGKAKDDFRALWRRLKPADKPDAGIPFRTDDAMFTLPAVSLPRPPSQCSLETMTFADSGDDLLIAEPPPPQGRQHQGAIPPEENIRRLFQDCKIARSNADVLCQVLAFAKPDALDTGLISEFLAKCHASQELIYTQIPWASASAERSRAEKAGHQHTHTHSVTHSSPDPLVADTEDTPNELTVEEELLVALLDANEAIVGALAMYFDLVRVADELQKERAR